ncbi:hypothetical protein E8E11_004299 [Didymella keratinophila]|nr:hypothetical protein E8E11_004299 [Didymella keratinophila]
MAELGVADSTAQELLRSTLILCGTGLRTQAKSYHVCNLAYYGLQSQMRPEDVQLLLTYAKPPDKSDMPPLGYEAVTSWPLPIISMSEDPKKAALSKMVKDYEISKARTNTTNNLTCIGSMYFFWYIMRWMMFPLPKHYEDLPGFARPTPYQIFVPHNHSFDFVLWPKLRDIAVQTTAMQERLEWLFDYSTYVRCDWAHTVEEALCKDPIAGFDVLTDAAKAHIFDLANWSTAPSLRAFVPNVDA